MHRMIQTLPSLFDELDLSTGSLRRPEDGAQESIA